MTTLLDQIKEISVDAAKELRTAGFTTDQEIRTLNRQDLLELLPGKDKLRVRKEIHELICRIPQPSNRKHSLHDIFKNITGLIPLDSFANALSDNGPLLEYLRVLKDHQVYLMSVQGLIEAQIDLLERARGGSYQVGSNKVYETNSNPSTTYSSSADSGTSHSGRFFSFLPNIWPSQQRQVSVFSSTETVTQPKSNPKIKVQTASVLYTEVVSGKTLDTHLGIIERINGEVPGHQVCLQLKKVTYENSQVVIVFCPVVSRVGTDVDSALQGISSDKPVIIVVMHHLHTPTSLPATRTKSRVELGVNVFFHETVNGLIHCSQNEEAITELKIKLLEYSTKRSFTNTPR